jgi:hypothetical protein
MRIEHYQFGKIVVDGTSYRADIALTPAGLKANWWRKDGHLLSRADLGSFDFTGITHLIVGTGAQNLMKIADDARDFCALHEIDLVAGVSGKAVDAYNRLPNETTIGLFHLTC